jgi:hypothetical protein
MGQAREQFLICFSLVGTLLFAGIVFGFAPLQLLLKSENQFSELCPEDSTGTCDAQNLQLLVMFTVATFLVNCISLPSGILLDKLGPVWMIAVAMVIMESGLVLMAYSDSATFNHFIVAYALIAVGGQMTLFSAFPCAFLILEQQSAIFASISCIFDSSCIVFQIFYTLHQEYGYTRKDMFLVYAVIGLVVYPTLIILWRFQAAAQGKADNEMEDEKSEDAGVIDNAEDKAYGSMNPSDEVAVPLNDRPLLQQLRTFEFVFIIIYATFGVFRANLYIGVNNTLLADLGDAKDNFLYTNIFGYLLPAGFLFIGLISWTTTKYGLSGSLHVTNTLAIVIFAIDCVPSLKVQVFNFLLFACFRAYLYSVMADYIAKTFGLKTLGRVTGAVFSLSSVINMSQAPLIAADNKYFDGNLNYLSGIMVVVGLLLALFIEFYRYQRNRDKHWVRWVGRNSANLDLPLLDQDASPETSRKVNSAVARSPSMGKKRAGMKAVVAPDGSGNVIFKKMMKVCRVMMPSWCPSHSPISYRV